MIWLDRLFWFTDFGNTLSYQYEIVSFPFTMDCAFINGGCGCLCPVPGCSDDRILTMPGSTVTYNSNQTWTYPNSGNNTLYGLTPLQPFTQGWSSQSILVSRAATELNAGFDPSRKVLPHTVIKHSININCGTSNNIVASYSFIYDHTRGRMRFYPFYENNCAPTSDAGLHDIIFIPELYVNEYFYHYDNTNSDIIIPSPGSLNYFPFNEINAGTCSILSVPIDPSLDEFFTDPSICSYPDYCFGFIFPSPYTLFSAPARSGRGEIIAGYEVTGANPTLNLLSTNPNTRHQYFIDQNIDLTTINPSENVIYNPSEVTVTSAATDLHFPSYYTFKTIRGLYPSETDADNDNTSDNGGTYADRRDVPVTTDLYSENAADPTNNHLYASRYYLQSGSKLTIDQCVKIFDATFDVDAGATMIFDDYSQIIGKEDKSTYSGRFKIQGLGGAILRNYAGIQYVQNGNITQAFPLNYIASSQIHAGNNVAATDDSDQPKGNYEIHTGADVTFKAGSYVHLANGFSVQGGNFHAQIASISTPDPCYDNNSPRLANSKKATSAASIPTVKVYPNPTSDKIMVSMPLFTGRENTTIVIMDAMGKEIYRAITSFYKGIAHLDVHAWATGLYSVKAFNPSLFASGTFVKE